MTNFIRRGGKFDLMCPIWWSVPETLEHIFVQCHDARLLWFGSPYSYKLSFVDFPSFLMGWEALLARSRVDTDGTLLLILAILTLWYI